MKIHKSFVLRQVAGMWTILAVAEKTVDFNGMLTINDAGALLWKRLEKGATIEELTAALTETYEISAEEARVDAEAFVDKLRGFGCIEE